jgi:TonB family protein
MKALGCAGLAMALAWTSASWAQPAKPAPVITDPDWLRKPTSDDMGAAYPVKAAKAGLSGRAMIKCIVTVTGALRACEVIGENPPAEGFGPAAMALSRVFLMKPRLADGIPVEAEISIPISFKTSAPIQSAASTGGPIDGGAAYTDPQWLKKPTLEEIWQVWPRKAASLGISGHAMIKCAVNLQGLLQACSVASETPPGRGFGRAALGLAPTFLMTPATRNGQPVESEITIPVGFESEPGKVLFLPNILIVEAPAWSKTPSVTEILAQIDKKVGDKFADGKVIFLCKLNKVTGGISECLVANASPGMDQFRAVANALVPKFQADAKTLAEVRARLDPTETEARVILSFAFPDMASPGWGKRYITHVQWAHPYDPPPAGQPTFPDAAVKAGLKTGSATVDCQIGAEGALSQCDVVSESTPGVGLGGLAKTIAEGWVANRWTEEGLPVAGARVRLPIKMTYGSKPLADLDPAFAGKP